MQQFIFSHINAILPSGIESASGFPVYGTAKVTMIFMVLAVIFLTVAYKFFDKLPRAHKFSEAKELFWTKAMVLAITGGLYSMAWDVWWHRSVGRDGLFEAPHVFLYSFTTAAALIGLYIWRHTNEKIWKRIVLAVLIVPISAPFDNFWHILFGVENLSKPVSLSWSPPHMALNIAVIIVFLMLLKVLRRHHEKKDQAFFGALIFSALHSLILFLVMPFHPIEGWGQVVGFWGGGIIGGVFIALAVAAQKWIKGNFSATLVGLFSLLLMFTSYGKEVGEGIIVMPHDRPPLWLYVFSYLGVAVFLDLTRKYLSVWKRVLLGTTLWSAILFLTASQFLLPQFQYSLEQGLQGVLSGIIAGCVLALGFRFLKK